MNQKQGDIVMKNYTIQRRRLLESYEIVLDRKCKMLSSSDLLAGLRCTAVPHGVVCRQFSRELSPHHWCLAGRPAEHLMTHRLQHQAELWKLTINHTLAHSITITTFLCLYFFYCTVMCVTVMPVSAYMALAFVFGFIQIN